MRVLVDDCKARSPRPRSPHMNNEEPINYSHYPEGQPPEKDEPEDEADGEGGSKDVNGEEVKMPLKYFV